MNAAPVASVGRARRTLRDVAVAAIALAIGLGGALVYHSLHDRGGGSAASPVSRSAHRVMTGRSPVAGVFPDAPPDASATASSVVGDAPAPAAPTPRAAVERFLDLERTGDFSGSFGYLSAGDRASTPTRAQWTEAHGQLPPVVAYRIDDVSERADHAEIAAHVDLRAGLDPIAGLTPAHARATWVAVPEDGGWRVAYAPSTLEPIYPPESGAVTAARAWVSDRQACRPGKQWNGPLLGVGAVSRAESLCHAQGTPRLGAVGGLPDTPGDESFLSAFGPDVGSWARVASVKAPVAMNVVTAPVGESWLVIGVLEASAGPTL